MRMIVNAIIIALTLTQSIRARIPEFLVAFNTNVNRANIWDTSTYNLYVMFPDGTNLTKLIQDIGPTPASDIIWSPDGNKLVFTGNIENLSGGMRDLYMKNITTGTIVNLTKLSFGPIFTQTGDYVQHVIQNPAWSPQGNKISFDVRFNNSNNSEIYVINADGTGAINVSNHPAPDFESSWSPDGTQIVFSSRRNNTTIDDPNTDLFVVNADGTGLTNLTSGTAVEVYYQWSPVEDKIAFASSLGRNIDLFVINPDGSGLMQLTNSGKYCCRPMWSPDGTRIAFVKEDSESSSTKWQIAVMNSDGSNPLQITNTPLQIWKYSWSPDGERILFSAAKDENSYPDLFIVNRDGTEQKNITNYPGLYEQLWSPIKFRGSEISVSKDTIHFDDVEYSQLPKVGESSSESLTVSNTGDLPLHIYNLSVNNPSFSILTDSVVLLPADSIHVGLTYNPTEATIDSGVITILSNDREYSELRIPLFGATLGAIGPKIVLSDRLDFGVIVLGKLYSEDVLIENRGNRDLQITSISYNADLLKNEISNMAIVPNGSSLISIIPSPLEAGLFTDTLRIYSNDPLYPEKKVVLSGRGIRPPEGPIHFDFHLANGDQNKRIIGNMSSDKNATLQMNISEVSGVNSWRLLITFDSRQLRYVNESFKAGDFLPDPTIMINVKTDSITITGTAEIAGNSRGGSLGFLSFEASEGFADSTKIVIREIYLRHTNGEDEERRVWSVATLKRETVINGVLQGDFNGDDVVAFDDFFLFADAFGRSDALFDLNGNGAVDFDDFFIFSDNFGKNQ